MIHSHYPYFVKNKNIYKNILKIFVFNKFFKITLLIIYLNKTSKIYNHYNKIKPTSTFEMKHIKNT